MSADIVENVEAAFRRHMEAHDYAKDLIKRIAFDIVPLVRDELAKANERAISVESQVRRCGGLYQDAQSALATVTAERDALREALEPFQQRVHSWMMTCFGEAISRDVIERNHRFLEEALELVQSTGCTASEAHQLVDYVYGRDVGETAQEIGGVMVTLAALCLALGEDMHAAGETELARIWTKVEQIRAKQAAKPKHSPLPQHVAALSRPEPKETTHD